MCVEQEYLLVLAYDKTIIILHNFEIQYKWVEHNQFNFSDCKFV